MFLKSMGFLRNPRHWKRHGFETFSGFEKLEKQDNIARWSARNRGATKVIFFKICAHYGKNAPLRARRVLFKFKSQEHALPPIMKFRKVLAYAAHPFPRVGKLVGRALTVFWKLLVRTLCPREIISMTEIISFLRSCVKHPIHGETTSDSGWSSIWWKCSPISSATW